MYLFSTKLQNNMQSKIDVEYNVLSIHRKILCH